MTTGRKVVGVEQVERRIVEIDTRLETPDMAVHPPVYCCPACEADDVDGDGIEMWQGFCPSCGSRVQWEFPKRADATP